MTREEAIEQLQNCKDLIKQDGQDYLDERDFPLLDMAIEALQGDMYCPNCGVRLVPENEYLEPTQTHGRLIDADKLKEYFFRPYSNEESYSNIDMAKIIDNAPTVHADRPHGEWIFRTDIPIGGGRESAGYVCSNCRKDYFRVDGMSFCPNCGCAMDDMRGGK